MINYYALITAVAVAVLIVLLLAIVIKLHLFRSMVLWKGNENVSVDCVWNLIGIFICVLVIASYFLKI